MYTFCQKQNSYLLQHKLLKVYPAEFVEMKTFCRVFMGYFMPFSHLEFGTKNVTSQ